MCITPRRHTTSDRQGRVRVSHLARSFSTGGLDVTNATDTTDTTKAADAPSSRERGGAPGPSTAPTDQVLARRAALGDRSAYAEIFHRHAAGMYRYALRMLDGDHGDAEEVVQEAMTKAWLHLPEFRGDSALRTWLFAITAAEVRSARRRRRPVPVDHRLLDVLDEDDKDATHEDAAHTELWSALDLALGELPWRQRASWLLREIEQLSYEEIAQILNTSTTVVRGQLHRARRQLAVRMAQWR